MKTILQGAGKVVIILLLIILTVIGFNYAFNWLNMASTLLNITGIFTIFAIIIADILIIKKMATKSHK